MTSHRHQRVEDSVRSSLSQLLLTEIRDPRLQLASVSEVKISRDLSVAQVAISLSDPEQDREECLEALQKAAGFLRHQLAQRLNLRRTPELRFRLDRGAEYSERIDVLLHEASHESPESGESLPSDRAGDSDDLVSDALASEDPESLT